MGKSMVERYEQMLAQDPSSSVFVELAKVVLERGEPDRAITICEMGLAHHPNSVVARVLWGKALIMQQRPAEAMEQFDQAIAIDRDNPHAYNLIGEVLLHKGLYRSALPLLKKAVALQPNDARVRQWLEQTQAALAGGPAPDLRDSTVLDTSIDLRTLDVPRPRADEPVAEEREPAARADSQTVPATPDPNRSTNDGPMSSVDWGGEAPATTDPELPAARTTPTPQAPAAKAGGPPVLEERAMESEPFVPGEPSLLADVPLVDAPPTTSLVDMPKVEVSAQAALAIAKEYERELRDKLRENSDRAEQAFIARHWPKLAVGGVLVVALLAGSWAFLHTRSANQNRTLGEELARARQLLQLDTPADYRAALAAAERGLEMDSASVEAQALAAYAHAVLFDEHGRRNEDREKAMTALTREGVREQYPVWALAAEYHLSLGNDRPAARQRVLESTLDVATVHTLAGQLLLARGDEKAGIARLKKALERDAKNVRALVAIAGYYQRHGDHARALELYAGSAAKLAPEHPERVIGAAESRLFQQTDLPTSRDELEKLRPDQLTAEQRAWRDLWLGRILAAVGEGKRAQQLLTEAIDAAPKLRFEFELALAEVDRKASDWDGSLKAAEAALRLRPASDEAKEAVGLALLARDRARDVLSRLTPAEGDRRVRLVRAAAWASLRDWKKVRTELAPTQVAGKYPSEAVVYLALADAAEGEAERAQAVLERTLAATRRSRAEVALALGRVYLQRGIVDKARAQFEEAAKDAEDYEGGCELGRLLLRLGMPDAAFEPLNVSVQRNGLHGESRAALARALLQLGRTPEALKQLDGWLRTGAESAVAYREQAFAFLQAGKVREAELAIARSMKLAPNDAEALRVQADVHFARGNVVGGVAALQRSNRVDPKDGVTFCAIARSYLRQGNSAGATKAYSAALRMDPTLPCGRIGEKLVAPPNRAALADLRSLAQQAPAVWDRAVAHAVLARNLSVSGMKSAMVEARREADEAVRLAPNLAETQYQLGLVATRTRDEQTALKALESAVQLDPGDARIRLALAEHLSRTAEGASRALAEYQMFLRLGPQMSEAARVRKTLPQLRKRVSVR